MMYYNTPNVNGYVRFIQKYRLGIIGLFIIFATVALSFYRPHLVTSDELFWLKESKELARTEAKEYSTTYVARLSVHIDRFNNGKKLELEALQKELENSKEIDQVDSLFSAYYIYNDKSGDDSSLVKAVDVQKMDAATLQQFVREVPEPYKQFTDTSFSTFSFFIHSKSPIFIEDLDSHLQYTISQPNENKEITGYLGYLILIFSVVALFFRMVFKNFISAIAGVVVIGLTLIGTFSFIYLVTGISEIHVAMPLIAVSIAMVDYLYFYYRWHVTQYKIDPERTIQKTLNRNLVPAYWTSLITALGLGGLLFIDSDIVKILSLSVIISSVMGYIINITFLPAFLSFFRVKHPKVSFGRFCYTFAKNEMHYNKTYLVLFLSATLFIMSVGAYQLLVKTNGLFANSVSHGVMILKTPYDVIDLDYIEKLQTFEQKLHEENEGVGEVTSLASILEMLNVANVQTKTFDEQGLMQALFFLELYELEPKLIDEESVTIKINFEDADPMEVVAWVQKYKDLDLYFIDKETLLSSAKLNKTVLLGMSLSTALIIIGLIMGRIFRSKEMVLVGFIVNAIPIAWFGLIVKVLDIPLSLEVLIAMTIAVGLASDATIHFAFKYFRSRYFGRTQKHSLEIMFFYSGVPVIIGSLILALVFASLNFTGIVSLELIGTYSSLLIMMSLITDLLILPVMLLAIDKFNRY